MSNKDAAIKIVKRLHHNGFQALLAGGCVRDMLLKRRAHDFDVATDARPKDVIKVFSRTLKVGAKFGVVIILIEGKSVEVATFRAETDYIDGRHPGKVEFVGAAEDAARRDFTINAMFYDPIGKKVIDYFDGKKDLKKKLIRTVGRPEERFGEDYLRMLRAVRFSTQLGFQIEPNTWSAICDRAGHITKISGERIAIELEGILANPNREVGASMLIDSGLADAIFPDLSAEQTNLGVLVLSKLRKKVDFALCLAAFFAACPIELSLEKIKILKLSRNTTKHIKFLLDRREVLLDDKISLAKLKLLLFEPYFWDLFELQKAIQKATNQSTRPLSKLRKRINELGDIELRPKPLLNGYELMKLGVVSGPALGQLAEEMYIVQLEGRLQTRDDARTWAKHWLEKHKQITEA